YERVFGPSYYAFNYANVHFIALNDIFWDVEKKEYHTELGAKQLKFIENDLKHVSKDTLIVLMMHIPLLNCVDKFQLFDMLDDFPYTLSLAAHWHHQAHFFFDADDSWHGPQPHHH